MQGPLSSFRMLPATQRVSESKVTPQSTAQFFRTIFPNNNSHLNSEKKLKTKSKHYVYVYACVPVRARPCTGPCACACLSVRACVRVCVSVCIMHLCVCVSVCLRVCVQICFAFVRSEGAGVGLQCIVALCVVEPVRLRGYELIHNIADIAFKKMIKM